MRSTLLFLGTFLGALTSLPVMALFYLGEKVADLPFAPFILFDWLARVLPGPLVTAGIDTLTSLLLFLNVDSMSETAKQAEQLLALGLFVVAGAALGFVLALLRRRRLASGAQIGLLLGLIPFGLLLIAIYTLGFSGPSTIVLPWLALLTLGWGAVLGWALDRVMVVGGDSTALPRRRRRLALLRMASGSLAVALGAWGLGQLFQRRNAAAEVASGAGQPLPTQPPTVTPDPLTATPMPATSTPAEAATATPAPRERIAPAPGTRPEITPNEEFYRIDINLRPPVIDSDEWAVEATGLFERPRSLTLDDFMAYPTRSQPITLACISNRIGGDLIGTSRWTGVRLRDLLADLGLQPEAEALFLEAEDGFYETVVMEDMLDPRTLLVYGMNGETLPVEHGYPLRIYIPNRYGMKQPKWITRMEAIPAWEPGYWVARGWSREARPNIISIIDTVAVAAAENGRIPVGGIAWAGDRGIQTVEVRVDGGNWAEAQLRTPPLSPLAWVQWRYNWPATPGDHRFTVRAIDGTGTLQVGEPSTVHPSGATGYHSVTATV